MSRKMLPYKVSAQKPLKLQLLYTFLQISGKVFFRLSMVELFKSIFIYAGMALANF
jgi:hypothetical protein